MNPSSGTEDTETTEPPTKIDRLSVVLLCSFFVLDQVFFVVLLTLLRPGVIWVGVIVWISSQLVLLGITARMRGWFLAFLASVLVLSHLYFALFFIAVDFPIIMSPTIIIPLIASIFLGKMLLILAASRTRAKP